MVLPPLIFRDPASAVNGYADTSVQPVAQQPTPLGGFGGSAIGFFGPSTQNIGASQSAGQLIAHQQNLFGGSVSSATRTFGPSTQNIGASQFAVHPVAHQQSPFGGTNLLSMASSVPFGESFSTSGSAFGPTFTNPIPIGAPTSSAHNFGSNTVNPSPFGVSTSANGFGTSNPIFGSAINPIAYTSKASAFGSTTANLIPSGAPTSSAHAFGSTTSNPSPFGAITSTSISFGECISGSTTASPLAFRGDGQSFYYNQQSGSCLRPYIQTKVSESHGHAINFISISAMDVYKNKSHEELRYEDYMRRIKVSTLFAPTPVASNNLLCLNPPIQLAATNVSNLVGQEQINLQQSTFTRSLFPGTSNLIPAIGSNAFVNYNTSPSAFHNFPVAIVTFIPPEVASDMLLLGTQKSPTTTPFGPPTTNVTSQPASLFVSPATTGAPSMSFSGHNVPNKTHSIAHTSSTPSNFGGNALFSSSGGQPTVSASAPSPVIGTPSSSSSRLFHFPPLPISSGTQEACNTTASWTLFGNKQSNKLDTSIPKGLEIIAEKLGFNPWSLEKGTANKLDSEFGPVLACVDADKDADIIALAEFAVEQHNALHKVDGLTFGKVVVACLEAVGGGRYHIVLETLMPERRFYAIVLRKGTHQSNHVTVLQKWISSKP